MAKYRRKANVIEATQWFPGADVPGVCIGPCARTDFEGTCAPHVHTIDLNAFLPLAAGDWILAALDGVHWSVCDPELFADLYEPVETAC